VLLAPTYLELLNIMNARASLPRKRIPFSTFIPARKQRINPPASPELAMAGKP